MLFIQKSTFLGVLFLLTFNNYFAQVLPKPNTSLNYNQIVIKHIPINEAVWYKIIISEFDSVASIKAISTKTVTDSSHVCIVSNLNFGKTYKWHVLAYNNKNKVINKSKEYIFSILNNEYNDNTKFKISQTYYNKQLVKDGIVWLDKYNCALDRKGNVVWQFPRKIKTPLIPDNLVDLHMCNNGNITLSNDTSIYYLTKDLDVIWYKHANMLNNQVKVKNIHHVFNQLSNGNFIALGATTEKFKLTENDSVSYKYDNHIILEFDSIGNLVWFWELKNHFNVNLIKSFLKKHGSKNNKLDVMLHANSVVYDSTYSNLYLGLRDFNRFIKIDKKTKNIIAEYGQKLTNDDTTVFETNFFSRQHDVKPIAPNTVLLFNNGEDEEKGKSSVLILKLPTNNKDKIEKIWELDLDVDTIYPGKATKFGSVQKLNNGNFLIGGGMNGRILEVTPNKKPVWDLYIQGKTLPIFDWGVFAQYRAYYNSSLYPYYFSVTQNKKEIKIVNEGTELDEYVIEIILNTVSKDVKSIQSSITKQINPNQSLTHLINNKQTKLVRVKSVNSGKVEVVKITE